MSDQTWWFVARSTGLVAYVLLGITVIGGLLLSTHLLGRRPPPDWMLDWHRFVGALAVVFTGVHMVALLADSYIEFGLEDLFIPFVSQWRPVALGFGVLALYLALAVEITSLLRRRLPRTLWRRIHYLSVPAFALATVHLLMAGEDASDTIVLIVVGVLIGMIVLLLCFWLPQLIRRRSHIFAGETTTPVLPNSSLRNVVNEPASEPRRAAVGAAQPHEPREHPRERLWSKH